MRKILKKKLQALYPLAVFLIFCFPARGVIQYRPVGSLERHEIAGGWAVAKPLEGVFSSSQNKAFFLDYSLYFPEVTALLPQPWQKIGAPGFALGGAFFRQGGALCPEGGKTPFFGSFGFKVRVSYFEKILPFMEYGLSRAGCAVFDFDKKPEYAPAPVKVKTYFSIGLNLSLKIIDRKSVYNLDQDYGLNDIGVRAQCRRYYRTNQPVFICSAGLSLLF